MKQKTTDARQWLISELMHALHSNEKLEIAIHALENIRDMASAPGKAPYGRITSLAKETLMKITPESS